MSTLLNILLGFAVVAVVVAYILGNRDGQIYQRRMHRCDVSYFAYTIPGDPYGIFIPFMSSETYGVQVGDEVSTVAGKVEVIEEVDPVGRSSGWYCVLVER